MTNRRETLGLMAGMTLSMVAGKSGFGSAVSEQDSQPRGRHEIRPLPFDAKGLKGLSEKLILSHHGNNYGGAVKNLNKVEMDLSQVNKETPPFVVSGLKERELTFRNSVALHEFYFGNLGGDDRVPAPLDEEFVREFGGRSQFEEQLRATGISLAGGSGWVVLAYDLYRGRSHLYWSGHHSQNEAASFPLLVMDMYEHAYQMDHGAAAAKYIDSFCADIHWAEVGARFERARKAGALLKTT
jgi:Fe-Mn family superoxide dismutase